MTGGDQPVLRTAVHRLRIDVVLLLVVLHEPPALAPAPEVLDGLAVDFLAMLIGDRIEIDLRLDDVEQRFFGSFLF